MLTFNYKIGFLNVVEWIGKGSAPYVMKPNMQVLLNMKLFTSDKELDHFVRPKGSVCLLLPNYLIDLRQSEEMILSNMSRSTRRNIRKAINNEEFILTELKNPTDEEIGKFGEFYNEFANEINIKKCNIGKLKAIRDKGALVISHITNRDDQVLCAHAYLINTKQAYGIYSVLRRYKRGDSQNSQIIGRANKYLDWKNIQSAKKRGCNWYNFGGKLFGEKEQGKNVNQYKKSFGSVNGYDVRIYKANGIRGKLFLLILHFYYKWRRKEEYAFTFETASNSKK